MTIINGKIPLYDLTALSVGGFLQANAAYWFEQWRIAAVKAGHNLTITSVADAYRNYAIQERIFRERYTPQKTGGGYYNDVRWWNNTRYVRKQGHAAAAIPGTSNHGKGLAVDLKSVGAEKGAYYQWLAATGPSYGFTNTEGKSVNELWHWVHNGKAIPNTSTPAHTPTHKPVQEEDDMSAAELALIRGDLNTIHEAIQATRADVSTVGDETRATRADVSTVHSAVLATAPAVVEAVLNTPIARGGSVGGTTSLASLIAWHDDGTARILDGQDVGGGVDVTAIREAITASVADALGNVSLTLTTKVG